MFAIKFFTKLTDEFTLGPGQSWVIKGHGQHMLFMPTLPLDLLWVAALTAIALGVKPHATPPWISRAQCRMAIASASLSSAGL